MKARALFFLFILFAFLPAQENNTCVLINGEQMIIGHTQYQSILDNFEEWKAVADTVTLDSSAVAKLKAIQQPVHVLLFLGTWCKDSRNGVPPFMAVYQAAHNPNIQVEIIGITRDKEDPEGLAAKYHIERVPTFVILKNGKEIGRLVEFPKKTFAQDLIELLTQSHAE